MSETTETEKRWWIKGLIFENCNCQVICHGHISYRQLCTHERCVGHWSIHIDRGQFHGVPLDDLNIIILYDTPQLMITGGWTEALYIDERAYKAQRQAIEHILTGQAGGPTGLSSAASLQSVLKPAISPSISRTRDAGRGCGLKGTSIRPSIASGVKTGAGMS